jgi:hypothetical protein
LGAAADLICRAIFLLIAKSPLFAAGANPQGAGKPARTMSFVTARTTHLSPRGQYRPNSIFRRDHPHPQALIVP